MTRALNSDNPSRRKSVTEASDEPITEKKKTANVFCRPIPGTKHHPCTPRAHQAGKRGTENTILPSYGEERDCSMRDPFSMKELKDVLKKVKRRKARGPDEIVGEMLKHLGACSRAVLLKIFNHSWMKGVVPAVWKEALIIPVPRGYRPISLLSCVDKLLERMMNRRLISHLESNSVLSPTPTGYRKFRSTENQLAHLAQNIEDAFPEKKKVLSVFFDLSNAFDSLERRTSRKTTEDRCASQDVHLDPALPVCKDCPSEA